MATDKKAYHREYMRAWRARLSEEKAAAIRAQKRLRANAMYAEDSTGKRAMVLRWKRNHPEHAAALWRNRRAREKGAGNGVTATEWALLVERYRGRCLCCGKETTLTVDHVVPLSKGGSNTIDNVQPLCRSCNSHKLTRTIDYRMPEVGSGY